MLRVERRYLDRITIPGAEIEYFLDKGESAKTKLLDITKISARFCINHQFEEGKMVNINILVKGHSPIKVKGYVVWTKKANELNTQAQAVVQFYPFGTDKRYNSIESYEHLTKLEEEFSQDLKIENNIYKG